MQAHCPTCGTPLLGSQPRTLPCRAPQPRPRLPGPAAARRAEHRGGMRTACRAGKGDVGSILREALRAQPAGEPAYQAGSAFLQELGLGSAADIARVLDVAMNPNSLYARHSDKKRAVNASARKLDVEADMRPVVAFLEAQGLDRASIVKVILEHPPVLSYSVEGRLAPFFEYLASIGAPDPGQLLLRRPTLLGLDPNGSLRQIVEYLQANEYSTERVLDILEKTL